MPSAEPLKSRARLWLLVAATATVALCAVIVLVASNDSSPPASFLANENMTPLQSVALGGRDWNLHEGSGSAEFQIRIRHGNTIVLACSGPGDATLTVGASAQALSALPPRADSVGTACHQNGMATSQVSFMFSSVHGRPTLPTSRSGTVLVSVQASKHTRWAFVAQQEAPGPTIPARSTND